jgi:hypothetical protein
MPGQCSPIDRGYSLPLPYNLELIETAGCAYMLPVKCLGCDQDAILVTGEGRAICPAGYQQRP